jgi:decaprenylphospho-beta-D-ribofuranose 2-oxidase
MIVGMSGKIYLAKDALIKKDVFKKTYTKSREFENVGHKYSAVGKFNSTQSRRLGLL